MFFLGPSHAPNVSLSSPRSASKAAAPASGYKPNSVKKSGLKFKFRTSAVDLDVSAPALEKKASIYNPDAKVAAPPVVPPPVPPSAASAAASLAVAETVETAAASATSAATSTRTSKKLLQVKSSGYGQSDPRHPKPKVTTMSSSSSSFPSLLLPPFSLLSSYSFPCSFFVPP